MGNTKGFILYSREELKKEPVASRVNHFREFENPFSEETEKQQAARCMDCGIPFCHGDTGCPVDNLIPEWNDLVYQGKWQDALENLHSTNNFPEFTGRLCPAPCETACVLGINSKPVSIKAIEKIIIDKGFEKNFIVPQKSSKQNGISVAIVGSGPAGLACGQQLARSGFQVTIFEKNSKIGGLLRYGIPDFKMEKFLIDRRIQQMQEEGVNFQVNTEVGVDILATDIIKKYDRFVLAGGCEQPRDLPIKGRNLEGIHFAMDFLTQQNYIGLGENVPNQILAKDKDVIVIGGGDTGSDCIGTCNRQGAKSITQFEIMPKPPLERSSSTPWPYWSLQLRTSSSHEEGGERMWSIQTKKFTSTDGKSVSGLECSSVEFLDGNFREIPNSTKVFPSQLVLLAMGFIHPVKKGLIEELQSKGLLLDKKGNIKANYNTQNAHRTSLDGVYACGDIRRGQSLIVWAIAEGRKCASAIMEDLI